MKKQYGLLFLLFAFLLPLLVLANDEIADRDIDITNDFADFGSKIEYYQDVKKVSKSDACKNAMDGVIIKDSLSVSRPDADFAYSEWFVKKDNILYYPVYIYDDTDNQESLNTYFYKYDCKKKKAREIAGPDNQTYYYGLFFDKNIMYLYHTWSEGHNYLVYSLSTNSFTHIKFDNFGQSREATKKITKFFNQFNINVFGSAFEQGWYGATIPYTFIDIDVKGIGLMRFSHFDEVNQKQYDLDLKVDLKKKKFIIK